MLQVAADKEGDGFLLKHIPIVISSYRDVKSDVIGILHSNGRCYAVSGNQTYEVVVP